LQQWQFKLLKCLQLALYVALNPVFIALGNLGVAKQPPNLGLCQKSWMTLDHESVVIIAVFSFFNK
jgi:hypothetical protein